MEKSETDMESRKDINELTILSVNENKSLKKITNLLSDLQNQLIERDKSLVDLKHSIHGVSGDNGLRSRIINSEDKISKIETKIEETKREILSLTDKSEEKIKSKNKETNNYNTDIIEKINNKLDKINKWIWTIQGESVILGIILYVTYTTLNKVIGDLLKTLVVGGG